MIDFATGSVVAGRYRLTEMFTGGEIVNVWKGVDTRANNEPIVLKIYHDGKKLHPFVVQFLKTEFAQTRSWKHPHLLHAKLFDLFDGVPYIVMPFMKRGALREQLPNRKNGNRMSEGEIVELVRQIAGAMSYLHMHNLVHQDICPGNILIGDGGEYLLSDFGLSRILYNTIVESEGASPILHPAYASPQLFDGQTANLADDIFSLGVMLFELTECVLPWGDIGGRALLEPGISVPVIKAPYSSALRLMIYKCLQRSPEDRPTAAHLVQWAKTYDPQQIAASESSQLEELRKSVEVARRKADSDAKRREELEAAKRSTEQKNAPDFGTGDATRLRLEEETRDRERRAQAAKEELRQRLLEEEKRRAAEQDESAHKQAGRGAMEQETRRQIEEEVRRKTEADMRRRMEEEARLKAEQEAKRRAEEEARRKREEELRRAAEEKARIERESETRKRIESEVRQKLESEAKLRAEADARRRMEEDARRAAEEEARRAAEELRRKTEEAARRKVEEEARRRAGEEAARRKAEEEAARRKADEEARHRTEEEAKRKAAEETRRKSEEESRRKAEEAHRKAEEAHRKAEEAENRSRELEEELQRKERELQQRTEETLRQAQEEARRIAEEEKRKLEEESRRNTEEAQRRAEDAQRKAEEAHQKAVELLRVKEQEADKKAAETLRKAEEKARRIAEEEKRRIAEEQERRNAEEQSRRRADEENARKREELLQKKEREAEQKAEETLRKAQEEVRRIAEEEARKVAEEKTRLVVEEAALRKEQTHAQAEESLRKAEEEARRIAEEQARRVAEEQARKVAEEETRRHAGEALKKMEMDLHAKLHEELRSREEAGKRLKEEEEARRKIEEEERRRAEENARNLAIEEARRKAAEDAKKRLEDSLNKIEDAVRRRLEEVLLTRSQEEAQRKAEEESRREEERIRLEIELDARKREQDRLRLESEERQKQIEEETRRRLEHEYEMRSLEEARRRAEEEVRREAERDLNQKMEQELRATREEEKRLEEEYEHRRATREFERSNRIQESLNDLLQNVDLDAAPGEETGAEEGRTASDANAEDPFAAPRRARRASALPDAAPRPEPAAPRDLPKPLPSRRKKLIGRLSILTVFVAALYFYLRPSIGEAVPETVLTVRIPSAIDQTLVPDLFTAFLNSRKANGLNAEPAADGSVRISALLPGVDKPVRFEAAPAGMGSGFESLADSRNDALVSLRRLGRDEREQIQRMGAAVSFNDEQVLGLSGLAVIVHPDNPLRSMETETVARMLSGDITSWKRRRGAADEIHLYLPLQTQDDYFNIESLLGPVNASRARVTFAPADSIAAATLADPQALGIVDRRFAAPAKILALLTAGSEARFPVPEEISQENYPLSTRLYLYSTDRVKNPVARAFLAFVQSDAGQAIVKRHSFVDQEISCLPRALPAGAPKEYDESTRGAQKLSFQLRNHVGSTAFDAKALQDLLRLKAFLGEPRNRSRELLILGFSNRLGSASSEELVASTMVKKTADKMREEGISPALIRGLGAISLVSEDLTEEGKARNRRVEIWIR